MNTSRIFNEDVIETLITFANTKGGMVTKNEFYNPGRLSDTISIDDLLSNNYKSTPRNKKIAGFFKNLELIGCISICRLAVDVLQTIKYLHNRSIDIVSLTGKRGAIRQLF